MTDKAKPKLTERKIQTALFLWLAYKRKHQLICPNYTPRRWHECDLFSVNGTGLGYEFEIKISRADFKNDVKKSRRVIDIFNWAEAERMDPQKLRGEVVKHDRLAKRDTDGPSRFYYVVPQGLLKPEEIPEWAGHIEIGEANGRLYVTEVKQAPKLHKTPVKTDVIAGLTKVFYWRFWTERQKNAKDDKKGVALNEDVSHDQESAE